MEDISLFLSKIIETYALYDLHKKRSKKFQYSTLPTRRENLDEREKFYESHQTDIIFELNCSEETDYRNGKFKYQSLIESGDSSNDVVTGEIFLNRNEDVPNVIFVHGWRMETNERVKKIFHKDILKLGWNMYYFTLPYHFDREPIGSHYSGEYMVSANIERTIKSTKQAVVDLRTLIHWIKTNKKGPVILIGISLGGFITNLTATVECEIDILASIFYANKLSYSIWNTSPGKFIKEDLEHHGVTYDKLIEYWKITEPSQALPQVNKKNILLICGKYDQYVHFEDTNYLWEAWERPNRYMYDCGHAGIVLKRKKIAMDTLAFIQKRIKS
ncbi:hypothetical protein RW25_27840 [Bacillus sp. L_1B0_8]|nr:hypothetical protein RW25_27840 [Bacillus sp. L_1B0_8]KIQ78657.1 hypothetical protein RT27_29470 [Bacillus sp. L_1B0_5]